MAKARQARRPTTSSAVHPTPRQRAGRRYQRWRPWWLVTLAALLVVAVLGLAAWWIRSTLIADETPAGSGGFQPIASLDVPDVHSLAIDPADPDHVLFGSHAGIKESYDGGFTWEDGSLRDADAMSLGVSLEDPDTFYAAGHDVFLVSRDGGQSWQPVQHNLPGTDIHAFAQDPTDPQQLYAFVVGHGVFASTDGGHSWQPLPAQPPGGSPLALATNGTTLYAATADGLVVSQDRGATWQTLAGQPAGSVVSLATPAGDPRRIYAGTSNGLLTSTDAGQTWVPVGPLGTTVLALASAPTEPQRVLFVSEAGAVYRSDDGGLTWREK